jgi:hypothetical protein
LNIVAAATVEARKAYPNIAEPDRAFARFVDAHPEVLRACEVAKSAGWLSVMPQLRANTDSVYREKMDAEVKKLAPMQIMPVFVGGREATASNNPKSALAQLNALVEEQRKRSPEMSAAQAFARVYRDNPALAAQERRENRPTGHPAYR